MVSVAIIDPRTSHAAELKAASEQEIAGVSAVGLSLDKLAVDESEVVPTHREDPDDSHLEDPDDSNIETVTPGDTPYTSAKRFEDLNLSPELLKGLYDEMHFEKPSKIQAIGLPMIMANTHKNLVAQAQNGSGKTTCLLLGMLSRVDPGIMAPQALCICPTRELAIQNMKVILRMGKFTAITSELAIPVGAHTSNYVKIRKRPPITAHVIIGTLGTVKKLMLATKLVMNQMKILVLDEAEYMLAEHSYQHGCLEIMEAIAKGNFNCQVLLSASCDVRASVSDDIFVKDYNLIFVKNLALDSVKQYKVRCPDERSKIMVTSKILDLGEKVQLTIIFVRTRDSASMLHKLLADLGYEVATIHDALKQDDRDKILEEIRGGWTPVLISTVLLARGFDQQNVNLVVFFDPPVKCDICGDPDYEVYSHWVGGRLGRKALVFNFLGDDRDDGIMDKIEKYLKFEVAEVTPWDNGEAYADALRNARLGI